MFDLPWPTIMWLLQAEPHGQTILLVILVVMMRGMKRALTKDREVIEELKETQTKHEARLVVLEQRGIHGS